MFEENEILTLILGIATALFVFFASPRIRFPGSRWFRGAVVFLALSYICTNLEALWFHDWFDMAEHFFLAIAGILALVFSIKLTKETPPR